MQQKQSVHQFGVFEIEFNCGTASATIDSNQEFLVEFISPSGKIIVTRAFWDNEQIWRVRFSPNEIGNWNWRSSALEVLKQDGSFECIPYLGQNPIYRRGPLGLSPDRRHLQHVDGTPFFWMSDTAWNGVIRSDNSNWAKYLKTRSAQCFNVIQFVCSHWKGDVVDESGEPCFYRQDPIRINPIFFQRIDRRVAMINEAGLIAAPVVIWNRITGDPGFALDEQDCIRLASYIVARYDAYQTVWLLGGDGDYHGSGIDKWKNIGRQVFCVGHDRLVSLHPMDWIGEEFRQEPWYDFIGYQSGHGDSNTALKWLLKGPPADFWDRKPTLPVINLEPNYETAFGYELSTQFSDYHIRRAAYWSVLVSPSAGVSYGHDAIWTWNFETGPAEGHPGWHGGATPPWYTGLQSPGIRCMGILKGIMEHVDWTTLKPSPEVLDLQPGEIDIQSFIAAARNFKGTVFIYAPKGGEVRFSPTANIPQPVYRVDPRTGEWMRQNRFTKNSVELPDTQDWVIVCGEISPPPVSIQLVLHQPGNPTD